MRIALSAAGLLLAANATFLLRMVHYRHALPENWASGVLILLRIRLLSGLQFMAQLIVLPFTVLPYHSLRLKPVEIMQILVKCLLYWGVLCLINLLAFVVFFGHRTLYFLRVNKWPIWAFRLGKWWRLHRATLLAAILHRTLLLLFFLIVGYLLNVLP